MPRENKIVSGSNNSAYAELAGQGPGQSGKIENQSPSIGRQEGQREEQNIDEQTDPSITKHDPYEKENSF